MTKTNAFKIISSIIISSVFLVLAYGSDGESKTESGETSTTVEGTTDDGSCSRCGGSGSVATYSALGCSDMSHFPSGDCGQDHHSDDCTSSGSKSCPCCHGSGKRSM